MNGLLLALVVVVVGLAAYLGYTLWMQRQETVKATPVSRATRNLMAKIKQEPNSVDLRMQLAQAFVVAGRNEDAIEQYNVVLKLQEDFTPALAGLGFVAARQKDWKTSEAYFRKVIGIYATKPGSNMSKQLETAHFYLGTALFEQKQYEEAAGEFKEALRLNDTASDTHYLLAMTYKELGQEKGLRQELDNALLLDPLMPEANYQLGLILLREGDVAGAAEHFRTAVNEAPGIAEPKDALDDLGPVADRVEEARAQLAPAPEKALTEARVAVAIDPRSIEAWVVLGDTYVKLKKKSDAQTAYRKALELDPKNPAANAGLKQVTDGTP